MAWGGLRSGQSTSTDAHMAYLPKVELTIWATLSIIKNVVVSSSRWLVVWTRVANTGFRGGMRRGVFFAHVLEAVESVVMTPGGPHDRHSRDEKKEWSWWTEKS